ncbi:hypothetical protein GQ600_23868 [Phytophthora cactorum]|nr:hypothetical protein GQ600_23868 [Phytophthora cactorum]
MITRFWLIDDANPEMTLAGAVGLIIVAITKSVIWTRIIGPSSRRAWILWADITAFDGKNRNDSSEFKNALLYTECVKLLALGMEKIMLRQLLQNGSPVALKYGFSVVQAVNSLFCVANVRTDQFSALTVVLIDSVYLHRFVTLVYCYYNFDFAREGYITYLENRPPGSFEHLAPNFAEIALFVKASTRFVSAHFSISW